MSIWGGLARRRGMDAAIVIAALALLAPLCTFATCRPGPVAGTRRIGPWVLGERIGEGGMGVVHRARHVGLDRVCALKLLPGPACPDKLARFEREARLTRELVHPNTVRVFDSGRTPDGGAYYAMELLEGETLRELVEREGALAPERVTEIIGAICSALEAVHARGLVHRDVSPDNVFVCRTADGGEVVKLLDFGLAMEIGEAQAPDLVVGTPLFISPEAIAAPHTVSAKSDIYSLGALAYYLLSARPPFDGETLIEVLSRHLHAEPERPSVAAGLRIPALLETAVLDCLRKNPLERPAAASELRARLAAGCELQAAA